MPVEIHGKQYRTVAERVAEFRDLSANSGADVEASIETEIVSIDSDRVVVKATVRLFNEVATGYAEEERGSSNINKTSALENAETSAVGRALAFFGLAGTEIASADEVANAIKQQTEKELLARWAAHTQKVEEHHDTLIAVRGFLSGDNFDAAREAWNEVSNEDKMILWRATTKGGWFTPRERQQMKYWSNDFEDKRRAS